MFTVEANEQEFARALAKWVKDTEAQFQVIVRALAFEIHDRVIDRTPVDSGRARASWNISINTPVLTVAPEPKKKSKRSALETARTVRAALPAFDAFSDTVWLTNAVPYILRLEHGSSKQAPVGMVAVTIAEVEAGILLRAL